MKVGASSQPGLEGVLATIICTLNLIRTYFGAIFPNQSAATDQECCCVELIGKLRRDRCAILTIYWYILPM